MVTNTNVAKNLAKDPLAQNGKENKAGTLQKPDEKKEGENKEEVKANATILQIVPPVKETPVVPTIQDRLKKLETLNQLLERRVLLADALDDVNSFVLVGSGVSHIRFTDCKNQTFSVSNPEVISVMLDVAKSKLAIELEKVDSQIVF